jgi:hypothetical protein
MRSITPLILLLIGGGTATSALADDLLPLSVTEAPAAVRLANQIIQPGADTGNPHHPELVGAAVVGGYFLFKSRRRRVI